MHVNCQSTLKSWWACTYLKYFVVCACIPMKYEMKFWCKNLVEVEHLCNSFHDMPVDMKLTNRCKKLNSVLSILHSLILGFFATRQLFSDVITPCDWLWFWTSRTIFTSLSVIYDGSTKGAQNLDFCYDVIKQRSLIQCS